MSKPAPKSLRILGKRYPVHIVDSGLMSNEDALGEACFTEQRIRLRDILRPDTEREVLLHEVVEVINNECCLELEHKQLGTISAVLYSVLSDNRGLAEYIGGSK
jgi:hypothetical protein